MQMNRRYILLTQTASELLGDLEEAAKENEPNVLTHDTQVRMKNLRNVLDHKEPEILPGPPFLIECPMCHNQYWVDPTNGENVYHDDFSLKNQCPYCGVKE